MQRPSFANREQEPVTFEGFIVLEVRIGVSEVQVLFRVVSQPAVNIYVGTVFLNRDMRGIFPSVRNNCPVHGLFS